MAIAALKKITKQGKERERRAWEDSWDREERIRAQAWHFQGRRWKAEKEEIEVG